MGNKKKDNNSYVRTLIFKIVHPIFPNINENKINEWEIFNDIFDKMQYDTWTVMNKSCKLIDRLYDHVQETALLATDDKDINNKRYEIIKKVIEDSTKEFKGSEEQIVLGYIYSILGECENISAVSRNEAIKVVITEYIKSMQKIRKGESNLSNFRKDKPVFFAGQNITLEREKNENDIYTNNFYFTVSILNRTSPVKQKYKLKDGKISFLVEEKGQIDLLKDIIDGKISMGAGKILRKENKKKYGKNNNGKKINYDYYLHISITEKKKDVKKELDPNKVLGVDIGVNNFIWARSSNWKENSFIISGVRIKHYRGLMKNRIKNISNSLKVGGKGRSGRGRKLKLNAVYRNGNTMSNYQNTTNFEAASKLIDHAINSSCGTIQLEKLKGIREYNKFLNEWPYYDLQQKIKYKCEKLNIRCIEVDPKYTSIRCSECGYIDYKNRPKVPNASVFKCLKCGYKTHADNNAAKNLSILHIDMVISEEVNEITRSKFSEFGFEKFKNKNKKIEIDKIKLDILESWRYKNIDINLTNKYWIIDSENKKEMFYAKNIFVAEKIKRYIDQGMKKENKDCDEYVDEYEDEYEDKYEEETV